MKGLRLGRVLLVGIPAAWLALFFALPLLIVLNIAFGESIIGQPPFLSPLRDGGFHPNFDNWALLAEDDLYLAALWESLRIAATATVICLLIGYPMAYAMARAPAAWRTPLQLAVILPFWTSFLIRVYAWMTLLGPEGPIEVLAQHLGLIHGSLGILYTPAAVQLGIVYSYLPFMVLPLYATLVKLDMRLLEAAADLGCRPFTAFLKVTLPLSLPGVVAGSMLVFIPAVGEFVVPDLLGGADALMLGKVLWTEFFSNRDWPMASAIAIALLVLLVGPILLVQRQEKGAASDAPG